MEVASEGSDKTALESLTEKYGFKAKAIITMSEVLEHKKLSADTKAAFSKYYEQYGVPGRKVI